MADRNPNPENVSKDSNSAELKSADDMRFDVVEKKRQIRRYYYWIQLLVPQFSVGLFCE